MTARNSPASPTISLFRGFPVDTSYTPSPFVNKLELRLRLGGVCYHVEEGSISRAPRGRIPYVKHEPAAAGANSQSHVEMLPDSTLIPRKLIEYNYMDDLNAALTPAERAKDLAVRALVEEKVYFYTLWIDNYYPTRDTILRVPLPIRAILGLYFYHDIKYRLKGQGALLLTHDEVVAFELEAWEAINQMLVESRQTWQEAGRTGPFWILGGTAPTEADATVFGFVIAYLDSKMAPATDRIIQGRFPVIVEYVRRIHERYFPEYTPRAAFGRKETVA
ncbi:hypothetical protein N658DRAFT_435135 [Parathielavia hyrcaniae]|uniref:Thioredoxin-like fold domain-containing protein n=1 Tax=Parathielavia hyrcaniae TaxID=113614 RepID=A0AAN6PX12_9PEZI|nr:hypothetical protein N658DRAFT_435135 [Parathielavia hyrcaniae]